MEELSLALCENRDSVYSYFAVFKNVNIGFKKGNWILLCKIDTWEGAVKYVTISKILTQYEW